MPIYEYRCPKCDEVIEMFQHVDEDAPFCKNCGTELEKIISNCSFVLVGSGWERDGYTSKTKNGGNT